MGSILSIDDFVDMVRRHFLVIVGVCLVGTTISVLYALSQKHLYTSSEVLQVQSPTIPDSLAPTTVAGSSARRLQLIEQRVMSRGAVLEAVGRLGLFAGQDAIKDSEKVAVIRSSVIIEGVAAARDGYSDDGTVSLLRITANWPTPEGAQMIAREFAKRTIDLSISSRLEQAEETLAFFALQESSLQAEITALEQEMTSYLATNDMTDPGGMEFTRREIETLNEAILNIDRQMITLQRRIAVEPQSRVAKRQQEEDQKLLSSLIAERLLLSTNVAELAATLNESPELELQLATYDRRMEDLRTQFQVVNNRRKDAAISFQLETQRQSERLTVLEPAPFPDYPFTRARKQIVVLGAFASILAGFVAAFLLDWHNPVVRSAAQMEREIGLRPVISIPAAGKAPRRRIPLGKRLALLLRPIMRRSLN